MPRSRRAANSEEAGTDHGRRDPVVGATGGPERSASAAESGAAMGWGETTVAATAPGGRAHRLGELASELDHRLGPTGGVLGHRTLQAVGKRRRHVGSVHAGDRVVGDLVERSEPARRRRVRGGAREQGVERCGQAVHVGRDGPAFALQHSGVGEGRGCQDRRGALVVHQGGDPEVDHLDVAELGEQDVLGLHVEMEDAAGVGVGEGVAQLGADRDDFVGAEGPPFVEEVSRASRR